MKERCFRTGERVKARRTIAEIIPAGTVGVVERVYVAVPGMYDVQFEGHRALKIVWGDDLEVAEREQEAGRRAINPSLREVAAS
jgi:hypothetical protein